jgi:phosphonatase-like hydrolase
MIRAVLFDVIGTTVKEKDPAIINRCFEQAFLNQGLTPDPAVLIANRGRNKREMISIMLQHAGLGDDLVAPIYQSFQQNVEDNLHNFEAQEGAEEIFEFLWHHQIKTGLGTGLTPDLFEKIIRYLRWPLHRFDYLGMPGGTLRGRPYPDMILDMMQKLGLTDSGSFLKVGDTVADIKEGKNAGVITVAVLAGTQNGDVLAKEKPDYIIGKLNELRAIVM